MVRLLWINPGEGGLDPCFKRGAVNAGRYCFKVDALALRPKCLWVGRWHGRGQTRRLRAQSFFCPAVNKRAAEALAENSCLRSDEAGKRRLFSEEAIGGRDAFGVPIDNRFEVLERLVGRTTQVSGQMSSGARFEMKTPERAEDYGGIRWACRARCLFLGVAARECLQQASRLRESFRTGRAY